MAVMNINSNIIGGGRKISISSVLIHAVFKGLLFMSAGVIINLIYKVLSIQTIELFILLVYIFFIGMAVPLVYFNISDNFNYVKYNKFN